MAVTHVRVTRVAGLLSYGTNEETGERYWVLPLRTDGEQGVIHLRLSQGMREEIIKTLQGR